MADFSFLSDSDDDKKVEELLSQAMDQSVLEQVSAINLSGFTDSVLPTHLETRFRKLKSFPASMPKSPSQSTRNNFASSSIRKTHLPSSQSANFQLPDSDPQSDDENGFLSPSEADSVEKKGFKSKSPSRSASSSSKLSNLSPENEIFSPSKQSLNGKMGLKSKSRSGFPVSPSKSTSFSKKNEVFTVSKQNPDVKSSAKSKSQSGSFLSPSNPSNSSMDSLSPPRKAGCFWCSPKRVSSKKSKENRIAGTSVDWGKNWAKDDEFLSDLSTFSTKEQQRMLKKAMEEEEEISREAEKIVKWAKQASARMDVSGLEDELSDNDSTK